MSEISTRLHVAQVGNGGPIDSVIVSNLTDRLQRDITQSPYKLYAVVSVKDDELMISEYKRGVSAIHMLDSTADDDGDTHIIGVRPPRISKVHRLREMEGLEPYPRVATGRCVPVQRRL